MGLIYRSVDSSNVIAALAKNLEHGQSVLAQLRSANIAALGSLDGGDLSGKAYAAARVLFEEQVGSAIAEHQELFDSIQRDLDTYVRQDAKVSPYAVLHEDELNVQLRASQAMKAETENLIEINTAVAGAISPVPLLGDSLRMLNRQLEMVVDQMDRTIRGLEDRLLALREFDAATGGIFQQSAIVSAASVSMVAAAKKVQGGPADADGHGFSLGPPRRPSITWDEDFIYNSDTPTFQDHANSVKWMAMLRGAQLLRAGDLADALAAYQHYWSNTGDPFVIDFQKAYGDDPVIAGNVDEAIRIAQISADSFAAEGRASFSITGRAGPAGGYPSTEAESHRRLPTVDERRRSGERRPGHDDRGCSCRGLLQLQPGAVRHRVGRVRRRERQIHRSRLGPTFRDDG
ncbi:hypothetical protein [Leifsonia shinshuensis]|uniref:Uncharacterized protein n=1 Tax=Leifsonia shinshuensis TaxID=150026 RepID=A0A7G6YAF4_9MICO|nr:hypothetical protein [Leifsonia shinshuensis]QNE35469.1 hypothetical protein F1C12_10255 [Leifsonia shinshuensis]